MNHHKLKLRKQSHLQLEKKIPRNKFKKVKDLYTENYKILMKEIEEDKKMERYTMLMHWKK